MAVARAGISLNILCTYPLLFLSYRNGVQELWTASGRAPGTPSTERQGALPRSNEAGGNCPEEKCF